MIKLTISKDELTCHKKYFYDNVVEELKQLKKEYKNKVFISKKQLKFLSLCLYYRKQLAIGKPYQLKKIQKIIDEKYADILEKDNSLKKVIEKAFDYDKFSLAYIGINILNKAKKKSGEPPKANFNNKNILIELYNELDTYNKEMTEEVKLEIKKLKGRITRKKLENIISEILITYITQKKISINVLAEWNPYIMQYHRNLRTCPYCNRQYITPLYSETGKVRADLDHFYSKSKYPYFSMSIYNLVPCCKFCNSSLKGLKEFSFDDKTPYEISIDDLAEFRYLPSYGVVFHEKNNSIHIYNEIFKIEELYKSHENVAESMLRQYYRYPFKRIKEIAETGLISEKELYNLIIGKISTKKKILDEPLNKFKRDIVKEIWGEAILKMIAK